jgi:hypothetical protein
MKMSSMLLLWGMGDKVSSFGSTEPSLSTSASSSKSGGGGGDDDDDDDDDRAGGSGFPH